MKNLSSISLALRHVEVLCRTVPVSKVAIVAPTPSSARALRNLIASFFPIGSHELQVYSQATFWDALSQIRARATGKPVHQLGGRFLSKQSLQSLLWTLPLDIFRPANAPEKHLLQLDAQFNDLLIAGVDPLRYKQFASRLDKNDSGHAAVHLELAGAYASWVHANSSSPSVDIPHLVFDMLQERDSAVLHAWTDSARSEMLHLVLLDAHRVHSATLALLHKLFGAGRTGAGTDGGLARGWRPSLSSVPADVLPGTVLALTGTDSGPMAGRARAALREIAHAAHANRAATADAGTSRVALPSYTWRVLEVQEAASVCSDPVRAGLMGMGTGSGNVPGGPSGKVPLVRRRSSVKRAAEAVPVPSDALTAVSTPPILASAMPPYLLGAFRGQYHQVLAGKNTVSRDAGSAVSPAPPAFIECVGISPDVHEFSAIARTVRWLMDAYGVGGAGGPTIGVLCRSTSAVREVSAAVRAELADRLGSTGMGAGGARLYAETRGSLSRVPEVRSLLGLLGVLSRPEDPQHWYTLACSPVYALPPYQVSRWARAAASDPEKRGIVYQIHAQAAPPQPRVSKSRASVSTRSSTEAPSTSTRAQALRVGGIERAAQGSGSGDDALPWPGSGGEVPLWGLSGGSSESESETRAENDEAGQAVVQLTSPVASQQPSSASSDDLEHSAAREPPVRRDNTVALISRRLLDDLQAVYASCKSNGSAGSALRTFLRRSGLESALTEPRTTGETDAAGAIAALLQAAHALEAPDAGPSELRAASKRALGLGSSLTGSGNANAPLTGLPLVAEALLSAVYKGELGLGLRYFAGAGNSGLTMSSSGEDDDEDVIDVLPLVSPVPEDSLLGPQAQAGVGMRMDPQLQLELGASAADAVCQQSFEQVMSALEDEGTVQQMDAILGGAEDGIFPRLQAFAPAAPLSTVFITTQRRGVENLYDYVILPGCTTGAFPGPFLDSSMPLPAPLFAPAYLSPSTADTSSDGQEHASTVPLLPRPMDKPEHTAAMRELFMSAIASARYGVLFSCPAPTSARPVSSTGRSRFLDELFGAPSPPVPVIGPPDGGAGKGKGVTGEVASPPPSSALSSSSPFVTATSGIGFPLAESTPLDTSERPDVQANNRLRVSYSAMNDYEWCPARYRWGRVESVGQQPSTVLLYGVALHASQAAAGEAVGDALYSILGEPLAEMLGMELAGASPFDVATGALAILTADDGAVSTGTLADFRRRIAALLPPLPALEEHMRTLYNASWVALETSHSKRTWDAASVAGGTTSESVRERWAENNSSERRIQGDGPLLHYTDASSANFGFSTKQLLALQASAYPAIQRVAAFEVSRMRALLTEDGASACRRGIDGPGGMLFGLPALVEKRFDLSLQSKLAGQVRVTGVIDRVDMSLGKSGHGMGNTSVREAVPLVREFKTSTQWKKGDDALRLQLRSSLQSDLYGLAVRTMAWKLNGGMAALGGRRALAAGMDGGMAEHPLEGQEASDGHVPQSSDGSRSQTLGRGFPPHVRNWDGTALLVHLEGIETGQVEGKVVGPKEMAIARARVLATCSNIRAADFAPTPSEHKCSYCSHSRLCDAAFAHGPAVTEARLREARETIFVVSGGDQVEEEGSVA